MPKQLTLGSLFDGSGGFPLAGLLNGVKPVWASEIEPFPIRVTTRRLPWMKHYGDISTINGAEVEPVDILCGGSPCQDLSVAGKRAGLEDGERSHLFYQMIRIAKEMRKATNGEYPKYLVWENVAGAFSSNDGEDFRCVLQAFCSICDDSVSVPEPVGGKWRKAGAVVGSDRSYAVGWRTLNAMYWGVPQRRERVFAVVSLTDQSAANLLFEREGLCRNPAESSRPWERFTRTPEAGTGTAGTRERESLTLKIRSGCEGGGKGPLVQNELSGTLATHNDQTLFVLDDQGGQQMTVRDDGVVGTLRAETHQHLPIVMDNAISAWGLDTYNQNADFEIAQTLRTALGGDNTPKVFAIENHPADSRVDIRDDGTCQTLTSRMGTGGQCATRHAERESR